MSFWHSRLALGGAAGMAFGVLLALVGTVSAELGEEALETFASDTIISSELVNENFARLEASVRDLESRLTEWGSGPTNMPGIDVGTWFTCPEGEFVCGVYLYQHTADDAYLGQVQCCGR
jgi:hypothetical protein